MQHSPKDGNVTNHKCYRHQRENAIGWNHEQELLDLEKKLLAKTPLDESIRKSIKELWKIYEGVPSVLRPVALEGFVVAATL
ncbi:hypothetical protein HDU91_005644 [Kappamyces sp. JEL0680]|nr:hypothetical protein HDU91_005644 [Kappamyces sp. JEL0680]